MSSVDELAGASSLALPPIRTDIEAAKTDLREHGMTRFRGAAPSDEIAQARERLIDQAAAEDALGCASRDSGSVPQAGGPNQRVWNLVNKGEIFRRLMMNATVHALVRHLLGKDVLLFSMAANIACKGAEAQMIHGDQLFAPADTPYPLITNCLWMLDDFTEDNGATRVAPRTQNAARWPHWTEIIPTAPATGPAGTIMVWDGRLWHGTGVNQTDSPRHAILAAYCVPFLRQQENSTMTVSPEVLASGSEEFLTLLGFRNWRGLGMVDGSDHGSLGTRPSAFSRELSLNRRCQGSCGP